MVTLFRSRVRKKSAQIVFFMIFPGFFIYWQLVISGLITPVLGGYAPLVGMLCVGFASVVMISTRTRVNWFDFLFVTFITTLGACVLWGAATGAQSWIIESYVSIITQWAALYLLFKILPFCRSTQRLMTCSVLLMVLFVVFNGLKGVFLLPEEMQLAGRLPTYQDFAFYLSVCAMAAIALLGKFSLRLGLIALCLPALVVLGARSELLLFVIFVMVSEVLRSSPMKWVPAVFASFAAAYLFGGLIDESSGNRVLYSVSEYLDGGSLPSDPLRDEVNRAAADVISRHPVGGSFGYYAPGQYAHNALSLWADFGVALFILYWMMIIASLLLLVRATIRDRADNHVAFGLALSLGSLVLLVSTKSFGYYVVPIVLGLTSSLISKGVRDEMPSALLSQTRVVE